MERRQSNGKGRGGGISKREERGVEGMRERRKDAKPLSFAKPCKMFSSHKINIVSANSLQSVT